MNILILKQLRRDHFLQAEYKSSHSVKDTNVSCKSNVALFEITFFYFVETFLYTPNQIS